MTFAIIVVAVVAIVFIGAFVENYRKKRLSARGSVDHRIQSGNTQGHEYRTQRITPMDPNGP